MIQLAEATTVSDKVRAIMGELRRRFEEIYGDRLVRLILYGSQARGDARWWSDVDVMAVLKGPVSWAAESNRVEQLLSEVSLAHDAVVTCAFVDEERYCNADSGLLRSVHEEGIAA